MKASAAINYPQSTIRPQSSLLLLMLGVRADHPHDPLAADDLAVLTNSFNAASYFHGFLTCRFFCRFLACPTGELSTLSKSE
jgi:hypothetical protein